MFQRNDSSSVCYQKIGYTLLCNVGRHVAAEHFHKGSAVFHDHILGEVKLSLADERTILTINGEDAAKFLSDRRKELGLADTDFEHLTMSDMRGVNAHLSCVDGVIKSGRDLNETMVLRHVTHDKVYDTMRAFYDDENAIVFGCAGLSGLLDQPLDTTSLGLFLFGEVCTVDGTAEFGNLMLSKLVIRTK